MSYTNVHPTAVIDPDAKIGRDVFIGPFSEIGGNAVVGDGTMIHGGIVEGRVGENCTIWRQAHVMDGAVIGDNVLLGANVFVADMASVGDKSHVMNNTCISRHVMIGEGVFVGSCVSFCNATNPAINGKIEHHPIAVMDKAWIGSNVSLMGGISVGELAIIGAGSVVTKSVPTGATVVGVPSKVISDGS